MARRKQLTNEAPETTIQSTETAAFDAGNAGQSVDSTVAVLDRPTAEEQARPAAADGEQHPRAKQFRINPFPVKSANLNGYKLKLQESRTEGKTWQMQIKFGDGSRDDMPSDAVLDHIKSQKVTVKTKSGDTREVQMFHWNDVDRAWGMGIDYETPASSRGQAEKVFKEVVSLVAEERDVGQQR